MDCFSIWELCIIQPDMIIYHMFHRIPWTYNVFISKILNTSWLLVLLTISTATFLLLLRIFQLTLLFLFIFKPLLWLCFNHVLRYTLILHFNLTQKAEKGFYIYTFINVYNCYDILNALSNLRRIDNNIHLFVLLYRHFMIMQIPRLLW